MSSRQALELPPLTTATLASLLPEVGELQSGSPLDLQGAPGDADATLQASRGPGWFPELGLLSLRWQRALGRRAARQIHFTCIARCLNAGRQGSLASGCSAGLRACTPAADGLLALVHVRLVCNALQQRGPARPWGKGRDLVLA